MSTAAAVHADSVPLSRSSLTARMLNMLASPGDVFDEVMDAPFNLANWRGPTLLVCLAAMFGFLVRLGNDVSESAWPLTGFAVTATAALAGSMWSAFVLWFIGRVFLKANVPFLKSLEIAGLTASIVALGHLVTALLVIASGNPHAQPTPVLLFAGKAATLAGARPFLDALNPFYLWTAFVLSIGLAKLSAVRTRQAAFWIFGYWVVARMLIALL